MERTTYTSEEVTRGDVAGALARAGFEVGPIVRSTLTVLDTFDGRLHAAGMRLELLEGDGTLLALADQGPVAAQAPVSARPLRAGDLPLGPLRARLAPLLDVRVLQPVLVLTCRKARAVRRDAAGKVRAAVGVSDALAVDGRPVGASTLLAAVEHLEGYGDDERNAHRVLEAAGLARLPGDLVDFLAGAAGVSLSGFVSSPTVPLERDEPALGAYRRVLANLAAAAQANWEGTVAHRDPEFLHDFRVAVRRTRSVLGEAKGILPGDIRARYREEFGWLGTVTGPARDLDVYEIEWPGYVAPLGPDAEAALQPLAAHIASLRDREHASVSEALRSERYRALMGPWTAWLGSAGSDGEDDRRAGKPVGRVIARRITEAHEAMLARGRNITPSTPAEELHELRKDAKRLRYLLECFGAVLAPPPRKAFVQRLKSLQDNLGEHQDTEVHSSQLRTFSRELFGDPSMSPDGLLAMGRLAERFELRRQAAREEFAGRFAGYDTPETALALRAMLKPAVKA